MRNIARERNSRNFSRKIIRVYTAILRKALYYFPCITLVKIMFYSETI